MLHIFKLIPLVSFNFNILVQVKALIDKKGIFAKFIIAADKLCKNSPFRKQFDFSPFLNGTRSKKEGKLIMLL